jgi:hypothetical protein
MKTEQQREQEYREAWDLWQKEAPEEAAKAGGPKWEKLGPAPKFDGDDHDPLALAADPGPQPEEPSSTDAACAVIEAVYLIAGTRDRKTKVRAEALLIAIGRSEKSEAQVAQENGLKSRAAVSKIVREYKAALKLKTHRATQSDAVVEASRERAKRVHEARKIDPKN